MRVGPPGRGPDLRTSPVYGGRVARHAIPELSHASGLALGILGSKVL